MKGMKKGKTVGEDEILVEMIEATGEFGIDKVTRLANMIYDTGYIPQKMRESTIIAIPKKGGTMECEKHRMIRNMSQLGNIILRVINNIIKQKIDSCVQEEEFGTEKVEER